ncbi:MAG: TIGR04282 family arsenosugar biosynthesis glycosyltransferase [Bacteroidetes bacterium]|nr:TIGR04282 family arsenosugar biosynthesis glycosyltransferase [Bacteroidota bacterium]
MKELLIIFVKNPIKGKVKTRLAKGIGDDKALLVYQSLLKYTKSVTKGLGVCKAVYYSDFIPENDIWTDGVFLKYLQKGENLGERMKNAFELAFEQKYESVAIIGSDCLMLTREIIQHAFSKLNTHDFAIGPAADGGYYLLGMNNFFELIFQNKRWSTPSIFEETLKDIRKQKKSFYLLPRLHDIDTLDDLKKTPMF